MDKEDNYLYGEDRKREERDPRKRKRQSSEMGYDGDTFEERKERGRSRSREKTGSRRGKSRSESPEEGYRMRGGSREDDWKKKSEAFLQKLNVAPPTDPRLAATGQGYPGSGGGQDRRQQQNYQAYPTGYPSGGGGGGYTYPPPSGAGSGTFQAGYQQQGQPGDSVDRRDERRSEWERDKGREEQDKRGGKERQRDYSGSSEEGGKKSKQGRLQSTHIFHIEGVRGS